MKGNFWSRASLLLVASMLSFASTASLKQNAVAAEASATAASIGKPAPPFSLTDSNGKKYSLADAAGKTVVLEWINFDCPFVKRQYTTGQMQKLQKTYTGKGIVWYSICSSADGRQGSYPPAKINELIKSNNASPTAYLFDPDGSVGHSYGATATPHMFIISNKGILVYAGAVDDNQTADISEKVDTNYVQKALDELLANKPVSAASTRAIGCSVKYAK